MRDRQHLEPGVGVDRRSRRTHTVKGYRLSGFTYTETCILFRHNRFRVDNWCRTGRQSGALAMHMTTGEAIRRIRKSLGMTQAELGALLNFSQPAISGLENDGPAAYDVRTLRLVARALEVPLAILVVESDEEADVDRRNFFRAAAFGSAGAAMAVVGATSSAATNTASIQVGADDVAEFADSVNEIHELDLLVGGDRLCRLAAGNVGYLRQLLDTASYTDQVGGALATVTAEMMTAAGWVHYDAGRGQEARAFYADAVQTATEAGDGISAAHAYMNASAIDLDTGSLVAGAHGLRHPQPQKAANLAQAAQNVARGRGGPKVRALAALREAQAQAVMDRAAMERALSTALRAYDSGRGYDPDWVWLPQAELDGLVGISYLFAADYPRAEQHLQNAIDAAAPWPREQVVWQLYLAHAYIAAGDPARACALLTADSATVGGFTSTRLQRKVDAITTAVRPHAAVPEVQQFLEQQAVRV